MTSHSCLYQENYSHSHYSCIIFQQCYIFILSDNFCLYFIFVLYLKGQTWGLGGFQCTAFRPKYFDWDYYSLVIYILLPLLIKGVNYTLIIRKLFSSIKKSRSLKADAAKK